MPLRRLVDSRCVGAAFDADVCFYFWIFRFFGLNERRRWRRRRSFSFLSCTTRTDSNFISHALCMWHNIWSETGPQDAECRCDYANEAVYGVWCLRVCVRCDGFSRRNVGQLTIIKPKALGLSPFSIVFVLFWSIFQFAFLYDRQFVILFANYGVLTHSSASIIHHNSWLVGMYTHG